MKGLHKIAALIFSILFAGLAAGCTPEAPAPHQIAAYPQAPGGDWYLPAQPDGGRLVYDAYLALDVEDPENAAARAARLAEEYGGYLVNSYASFLNGDATVTLELRIPPHNFEPARRSFHTLGRLARETVSGEWVGGRSGSEQYAQFTLFFRRQDPPFPPPNLTGWRPGETLRQALSISARLMGFVIDLLIWVVVILGPFALLGWAGAWIARRLQQPRSIQEINPSSEPSSDQHDGSPENRRVSQ